MEDQDTTRFALTLHYDGSAFHGWQLQPDHRTVQGALEAVLTRLADRPRSVIGSGRTDAGVHAAGQIAAVDMPAVWSTEELQRALDALLPPDVWVEAVREVARDFHPRYDAVARTYEYRVGTARAAASPFHRRWCWPLGAELDRHVLDEMADELRGERSFRAFAKAGQPDRGHLCTVTAAGWARWELGVAFRITANRFLHHMVRYLVGTMVDAARGARPAGDLRRMLDGEAGIETSPPAPPEGLCLVGVEYPERVFTEERRELTGERSATPA